MKATAAPDSITVFRANLLGDFSDVKDWHWSLVSARGVPPAAPAPTLQPQATSVLQPLPQAAPAQSSSAVPAPAEKH